MKATNTLKKHGWASSLPIVSGGGAKLQRAAIRRILPLLLGGVTLLASPLVRNAHADTDFVREWSKNNPPLLLVYSPDAAPTAQRIEKTIRKSADFQRRKNAILKTVPLADAPAIIAASPRPPTVVVLLAGPGGQSVPPALNLPLDLPAAVKEHRSVLNAVRVADKPGDLAFRVGLYAPDTERLNRLADELLTRKVDDFRALPFERQYRLNRVFVFSPPGWDDTLKSWAKENRSGVWDDTRRFDLAEREKMMATDTVEAAEVYLIDRSRVKEGDVPASAARLLAPYAPLRETMVVVAHGETEDGRPLVVVSAPSRTLLQSRINAYPSVTTLAAAQPPVTEVLNLTQAGNTSLIVLGDGLPPDMLTSLHTRLARSLREDYHVAVEPRGPVLAKLEADLALQMARGAEGTQGMLQRRYPTRYVWVYTISDAGGGTTYTPSERSLTPPLRKFTDSEPSRPSRRKDESDEDYERRKRNYRDDWDKWNRARKSYESHYNNDSVEWEQTVSRQSVAHVRGTLQFIDTKSPNGARVVWEQEERGEQSDQGIHQTQRTTVKGFDARPGSLETPANVTTYRPDLLLAAAANAGARTMRWLWRDAMLPESAPPATATVALIAGEITPDAPPPNTRPTNANPTGTLVWAAGKVAEVEGKMVTLNIGKNRGVKVGDQFEVALHYKETLDPDTGRLLRLRVTDSLLIRVVYVEAEVADAVPVNANQGARLAQTPVGTPIRRVTPASGNVSAKP